MVNEILPIEENMQQNSSASSDASASSWWLVKYNRSIDEIQQLLNDCGNSITKTIAILRERQMSGSPE